MLNNILLIVALIGISASVLFQLRQHRHQYGTNRLKTRPDSLPASLPLLAEKRSMSSELSALLTELEAFGQQHDQVCDNRTERMLNITRDTGEFLACIAIAMKTRRILEIGTSNGYSTLWLAEAMRQIHGEVVTIDVAENKIGLASGNFKKSGLTPFIRQLHADAAHILPLCAAGSFDLVFLDAERSEYLAWWPAIRSVLAPGGLLVVDNAISHAQELSGFFQQVRLDAEFRTALIPVGKGEFLAARLSSQASHSEPSA